MVKKVIVCVILFAIFTAVAMAIVDISITDHEARLYRFLFQDSEYSRQLRPVARFVDHLCVQMAMSVYQIYEIKERDQLMTINMWLVLNWTDVHMTWDPERYGGISQIAVPSEWLWLPDIALYNNADGDYQITMMTNVLITNDGQVKWDAPVIYKSSCVIDVTWFPFDQQTCSMKFGPWSHAANYLDIFLGSKSADLGDYVPSGQWDLELVYGNRSTIIYPGCCGDEPYVDITYYFLLTRRPLFYVVNLLIPCVLISFLTVLVFYLPSDAGEKVTLCISVFLALTVFLLIIAEIIPPTSEVVPLIEKYLVFVMTMVGISVVITVIVLNIHHRAPSTHTMPTWVRRVFIELLPPLVFMTRPNGNNDLTLEFLEARLFGEECLDEKSVTTDGLATDVRRSSSGHTLEPPDKQYSANPEIHRAILNVQYIAQHIKKEIDFGDECDDWKFIAMVVDRLFLIIFIIVITVGSLSMIIQAPQISNPGVSKVVPQLTRMDSECGYWTQ